MSKDLENPFIRDFFEQAKGTVFCLSEARWRARDSRALLEIVRRFPPAQFEVEAIYAKARHSGTFDIRDLRDLHAELVGKTGRPQPSATEFLTSLEKVAEEREKKLAQEENLQVPEKGPIIILGRPESYAGYAQKNSEFYKLVEASGFPNRFKFKSDSPTIQAGQETNQNPDYRKIWDRRTGSEYEHIEEEKNGKKLIKDFAVIYATRLKKHFHTHDRLVTIVGGTGTIGTLGATKLLMDSEELQKACPVLRKVDRWPIELLVVVEAQFEKEPIEEVYDVSIKGVQIALPVSRGFAPRQIPPGEILTRLTQEISATGTIHDYTDRWQPPGLPLNVQLVGKPGGPVEEVVQELRLRARDTYPILIQGESGVGKEIAARLFFLFNAFWRATTPEGWKQTCGPIKRRDDKLRQRSGELRRHVGLPKVGEMSFVDVSCGALHENLIHSELFGHVMGAFTGADRERNGAFLSAGAGTLFLDEIHHLSLEQQGVFLRALQEREIRPAGLDWTLPYACNVVAASNVNLDQRVRRNLFRGDLLNRFRRVTIPPLNERLEDVLAHVIQLLFMRSDKHTRLPFRVDMTERFIRLLLAQNFRTKNFRWLASLVTAAEDKRDTQTKPPILKGEFLPSDLGSQLPDKYEGKQLGFKAKFADGFDFHYQDIPALFMRPESETEEPFSRLTPATVETMAGQVQRWFKNAKGLDALRDRNVLTTVSRRCDWCGETYAGFGPVEPIYWYLGELAREQKWADSKLNLSSREATAWSTLILELWHHLDLSQDALGGLFNMSRDTMAKLIQKAHDVMAARRVT